MNGNIIDDVITVLSSKKIEGNRNLARYLRDSERAKFQGKSKTKKESTLLPIEERYKTYYRNSEQEISK